MGALRRAWMIEFHRDKLRRWERFHTQAMLQLTLGRSNSVL